jgi:hypothetical protein
MTIIVIMTDVVQGEVEVETLALTGWKAPGAAAGVLFGDDGKRK